MGTREIEGGELAEALGLSIDEFKALIEGKRRLTATDARVLAEHLGSTARFWLARDKGYVLDAARLDERGGVDETISWVASMPTSSMRKFGWVSKEARSRDKLKSEILTFFGCGSLREWGELYSSGIGAVAFRTSLCLPSDGMATLVWLRAGELSAGRLILPKFNHEAFGRLLPRLKKLSAFKRPSIFLPRLIEACREVGVAVVAVRAPDGCRASGASWFDARGNASILLSFRHLAEDHFWFTFFHEAAHVLLHGKSHIDGEGSDVTGKETARQESEANEFAGQILFPPELRSELASRGLKPRSIMGAARAAGITAGIVVGQLERAGMIRYGQLNFLKHRYRWGEDPTVPELVR
jgi:plasmid maintenance system antidote protein VapI/Zn-dependent peptidase ImmA (M78 family)